MARQAAVVLGANPQSVADLPTRWPPVIHPACALDFEGLPRPSEPSSQAPSASTPGRSVRRRAMFAGRLLPFKGLRLGLEALRRPAAAEWDLDIYGQGPEESALRRLIDRWGLATRVRLHGRVGRDTTLGEMARADAFFFPSLHDCSPWVVGEAMALGCPVVGLHWGGIPTMLGDSGAGIAVPLRGDVAGRLAEALASLQGRTNCRLEFERSRLTDLLDGWYRLAVERGP